MSLEKSSNIKSRKINFQPDICFSKIVELIINFRKLNGHTKLLIGGVKEGLSWCQFKI